MLRIIVVFLISLYQRLLSPYKGYRCAHAVLHQGPSCSAAVKDIVREHGVLGALPRARQRFAQCRMAYRSLQDETEEERRRRRRQQGRGCARSDNDSCGVLDCGDLAPGECSPGDSDAGACSFGDSD